MGEASAGTGRGITRNALLTLPNITYLLTLLCCALSGVLRDYADYIAYALLALCVVNWNGKGLYLYAAVMLFFGQRFTLFNGNVPLCGGYACLLAFRFAFDMGKMRFRPQFIPALAVMTGYCLLAVGRKDMPSGLIQLSGALICFLAASVIRQDAELFREMTLALPLCAVCAGISGALGENTELAVCLYGAALFFALCSGAVCRWYFRLPLAAVLAYFIASSGDAVGICRCAALICIYVILRFKLRGALAVAIACCAAALVINVGRLSVPDIISADSLDKWSASFEYFRDLPLINRLIGGNAFTEEIGASNQGYIQALMYFGAIGAIIVFGTRIWQTISDACGCLMGKNAAIPEDIARAVVLSAAAFLAYALTSDVFMDWRLMLFYFI